MNGDLHRTKWEMARLDSLQAPGDYTFVGGPFGSDLTSEDYVSLPGVPVIRGTNLGGSESRFIDEGFVYVSDEKAETLRRNMAFPGDLIFTQRGTLGQMAIVPSDAKFSRYVISQSQMKLAVDPSKADSRYVYYAFRTPNAQARLLSRTQATGVPHINLGILREFSIPLPPLSEQRRIADILDKADAIRRKRRDAVAFVERLIPAIYDEMFGDPVTNTQEWETMAINKTAEFISGGTPSKARPDFWTGSTPWVSPKDMKVNYLSDAQDHISQAALDGTTLKVIPKKSILIVVRGMIMVHTVPIASNDVPVTINQDMKAIVPGDRVRPDYLLWTLKAAHSYLFSRVSTAAHGTKRLEVESIADLEIPLPDLGLQDDFARRVEQVRSIESRCRDCVAQSEELFDSIVQRAFRGEL